MSPRMRGAASGAAKLHRVVLDTNVVMSALVRVPAYPTFRLDARQQRELLADYLPHTEVVRIAQPAPAVPLCRDPFDMPFLHLASAGGAGALVSGGADLLTLARVGNCPIITAEAFLSGLLPSVA